MVAIDCAVCGAAREVSNFVAARGTGKYCSRECYYASKMTRVTIPCGVCGRAFIAYPSKVAKGNGKYCSRACTAEAKRKENAVKSNSAYQCWRGMRKRCLDPSTASFALYGGRGITVCDRWLESFDAFLEDMGPRPEGHSIDRIDVNGNYEPENCRWATARMQATNRRSSLLVRHNGRDVALREYAEMRGVHYPALYHRVRRHGDNPHRAADDLLAEVGFGQRQH